LKKPDKFYAIFHENVKIFYRFLTKFAIFDTNGTVKWGRISKIRVLPTFLGEFDQISCNFVKIAKINEKCENVQENMMVDFRHNLEYPHF